MATYTENYNLIQPEDTDPYDVADFNENMAAIDEALADAEGMAAAAANTAAEINGKIGTGDAGETLFSLLKAGGNVSVVKSIQRKKIEFTISSTWSTVNIPIETVDPDKSLVFLDRVTMDDEFQQYYYTLYADHLALSCRTYQAYGQSLMLQIIEFY